jgi:hypothetical protein
MASGTTAQSSRHEEDELERSFFC